MAKAKTNFSRGMDLPIAETLALSPSESRMGLDEYEAWHWGSGATEVVDWNDVDYPRLLVQCGRLVRIHVRLPRSEGQGKHPRRDRDAMIEFSLATTKNNHIAYDPTSPTQRLYLLINPKALPPLKKRFWDENTGPVMPLGEIGVLAGGRHATRSSYPAVFVKPVGVMSAVVYHTLKKPDGLSFYIHKMAEVSGKYPILCCDDRGRLWVAGGNYTVPTPGITD